MSPNRYRALDFAGMTKAYSKYATRLPIWQAHYQGPGLARARRRRRVRGDRRGARLPAPGLQPALQRGERLRPRRPVVLADGPELPAPLRAVAGRGRRPRPVRGARRTGPHRPRPARRVGPLLGAARVLPRPPGGPAGAR